MRYAVWMRSTQPMLVYPLFLSSPILSYRRKLLPWTWKGFRLPGGGCDASVNLSPL
jgi:hypothetical protein